MRRSDLERLGSVRGFQAFLRSNGLMFACAESCTGGLVARQMTSLAGSSQVFWGGVVTYANEAKSRLLGVADSVLLTAGAVSGAAAVAMAESIAMVSSCPVAVAVTGIAGPGGGSPDKPVGTVWFGLAAVREGRSRAAAVRHTFGGSRARIQTQAARWALALAAGWWLEGMDLDSLKAVTDNAFKPFIEASHPPVSFSPKTL